MNRPTRARLFERRRELGNDAFPGWTPTYDRVSAGADNDRDPQAGRLAVRVPIGLPHAQAGCPFDYRQRYPTHRQVGNLPHGLAGCPFVYRQGYPTGRGHRGRPRKNPCPHGHPHERAEYLLFKRIGSNSRRKNGGKISDRRIGTEK